MTSTSLSSNLKLKKYLDCLKKTTRPSGWMLTEETKKLAIKIVLFRHILDVFFTWAKFYVLKSKRKQASFLTNICDQMK